MILWQDKLRQSLQKLHVVVSNICNSPENIAFRHIPRDNAHFHSDLGQYAGGHQCLFALGFKEVEPEEGVVVFTLEVGMLFYPLFVWILSVVI